MRYSPTQSFKISKLILCISPCGILDVGSWRMRRCAFLIPNIITRWHPAPPWHCTKIVEKYLFAHSCMFWCMTSNLFNSIMSSVLCSVSWAQERWQRKYVHGTVRQSAVRRILILWNIFLLPNNANMQILKEVPILLQQYVSITMAMDAWWKWYCLMKNASNSSKAAMSTLSCVRQRLCVFSQEGGETQHSGPIFLSSQV